MAWNPIAERTQFPLEEPYPFETSKTTPFFPPVCLKSPWDPTMMLRHIIPQQQVAVPVSFRPWTKICTEYTTAGPVEAPPPVPADMVFPPGGDVNYQDPTRYQRAIDKESLLRRLDRPLGTCEADQYEPSEHGDMYNAAVMAPDRKFAPSSSMIQELAMPRVLIRSAPYECRARDDEFNMSRSRLLFNNSTKQERYDKYQRSDVKVSTSVGPIAAPVNRY